MDFNKTSLLLQKINQLHNSLQVENDSLSSIDKDVLLRNISELYEVIKLDSPVAQKARPTDIFPVSPSNSSVQTKAPIIEEKVITPGSEPIEETQEMSDFIKSVNDEITLTTKVEPSIPIEEEEKEEEPSYAAADDVSNIHQTSNSYAALFAEDQNNDLSNKLSQKPISDIYSAMGLNDRFLILNDLFNEDKNTFSITIDELNKLNSFDEAKTYLSNSIIPEYNWDDEQKIDRAKSFLQTIKRRYL